MREIKFRGKKKNGTWLFGDLVQRPPIALIFPLDAPDSQDNYIVDLKTVGQFTGLTDKTGVEIYDGDIVYIEGYGISKHKTKIIFEESEAKFSTNTIYESDCFEHSSRCIEVIGNMFDNPELL